MKKIAPILPLLCLGFSPLFSQNVNWFQPTDNWSFHIQSGWIGPGIEKIRPAATDSTVNGKVYRKIEGEAKFANGNKHNYLRLARQEGAKIFAIAPQTGQELKLYDFGLAVGDSVMLPIDAWAGGFGYIVTGIETVDFGGQQRLVQTVTWLPGSTYVNAQVGRFVEGIGNVEGLHLIGGEWCLAESYLFPDEPGNIVVDGEIRHFCSFSSPLGEFEGLGSTLCKPAASTKSPAAPVVQISPNPSAGSFQILVENGRPIERAELFDLTGRLVENLTLGAGGEAVTGFKGLGIVAVRTGEGVVRRKVFFQ